MRTTFAIIGLVSWLVGAGPTPLIASGGGDTAAIADGAGACHCCCDSASCPCCDPALGRGADERPADRRSAAVSARSCPCAAPGVPVAPSATVSIATIAHSDTPRFSGEDPENDETRLWRISDDVLPPHAGAPPPPPERAPPRTS